MPSAISNRLKTWFVVAALVLIASFGVRFMTFESVFQATQEAAKSRELLRRLEALLSTLKEAEIGQRDYLITGGCPILGALSRGQIAARRATGGPRGVDRRQPRSARAARSTWQNLNLRLAELTTTIERREHEAAKAGQASVEVDQARKLLQFGRRHRRCHDRGGRTAAQRQATASADRRTIQFDHFFRPGRVQPAAHGGAVQRGAPRSEQTCGRRRHAATARAAPAAGRRVERHRHPVHRRERQLPSTRTTPFCN